jgi:hypothetical protein
MTTVAPSRQHVDETGRTAPYVDGDTPGDPFEDEWEEVSLEGGEQINWDETPNVEGVFKGSRQVDHEGETLTMLVFDDKTQGRCFCWAGPKLLEAFTNVVPGSEIRCQYTGNKDVGRPSPMRMFKVQVRKGSGGVMATERTPRYEPKPGEEPF